MWKRKSKTEWLPWYRARNYKGDLTETEKRQFDALRGQPKHPAADLDDLPEEVRGYIGRIEMELYDKKQEGAAGQSLFFITMGMAVLFANYWFNAPLWSYAVAVATIVLAWVWYVREWNKNAQEFLPSDHFHNPTQEGIRQEWELEHIVRSRQAARGMASEID